MLRLTVPTADRYAEICLADLGALLIDHAHCEHKAAVTALSFVSKYPDDPRLVTELAKLARDEANHFARMVEVCIRRGLSLGHPEEDLYVQRLLKGAVRPSVREQRVDRLLVCALIEARACERLQIIARALAAQGTDTELIALYDELWREEATHHVLFTELAERAAGASVTGRLGELLELEGRIVRELPVRPAIH